jgi:hypothetical protein
MPVIIIPAFSRPLALLRLLNAINNASFPEKRPHIIVSIDGGGPESVKKIAKEFSFDQSSYDVICQSDNLGLRKHIIWCGDQTEIYESVILIEDDIHVDKYFYHYAVSCMEFYESDEDVAGIALYSPRYNQYAGLPFEPMYNGTSTYFMQVPCSWGQIWTKNQWKKFKDWYGDGEVKKVNNCPNIPEQVKSWPDQSWKKYFGAYLVDSQRYFVYPYISYSTNFCDGGGAHVKKQTNLYQTPLSFPLRECENFSFKSLKDLGMSYDAFFEPSPGYLEKLFGLNENSLVVDIYALKNRETLISRTFCLTSRKVRSEIMSFPLNLRPIELSFLTETVNDNTSFLKVYLAKNSCVFINKKMSMFEFNEFLSYSNYRSPQFSISFLYFTLLRISNKFKNMSLFR